MNRVRPIWRAGLALVVLGVPVLVALQIARLIEVREFARSAPVCRVETAQRMIALTFDDGPDATFTPAVLDLLRANDAKATFFLVGSRAIAHPDLVNAEVAAGMEIEDHTQTHPRLLDMSASGALEEADRARSALVAYQAHISLFRAPFGDVSPEQAVALRTDGFKLIHWSFAMDHYVAGMAPSSAARALATAVRPGDIILAHDSALPGDGGGERRAALDALAILVPALRNGGFALTTVGTLLGAGEPVLAEPRRWFWQTGFTCPR